MISSTSLPSGSGKYSISYDLMRVPSRAGLQENQDTVEVLTRSHNRLRSYLYCYLKTLIKDYQDLALEVAIISLYANL